MFDIREMYVDSSIRFYVNAFNRDSFDSVIQVTIDKKRLLDLKPLAAFAQTHVKVRASRSTF